MSMFNNFKRWINTNPCDFVSTSAEEMATLHNGFSDMGLKLVGVRTSHKYRPLVDTVYVSTVNCTPDDIKVMRMRGLIY